MAWWNLFRYVWSHPLNSTGRMAAIGRVFRWQFASRLMPSLIALPFVENTCLFATRGMTGATGNWYCGLHEIHEMAFVLHLLRPGDHFLDVGANIGSYAILAAGGAKAKVTTVEPIPDTFEHLQRNVVLNRLEVRVRCCQVGLSSQSGALRFSLGMDTVNHVMVSGEDLPSIEVPVMRMDDLVGDDVPLLIKIDVEGHELSVLLGGARTLKDPRLLAVIMETNGSGLRYGVTDEQLMKIMQEYGFTAFGYDPFSRTLVDVITSGGNTVFVRDRATVQDKVKSAGAFRLVNGTV